MAAMEAKGLGGRAIFNGETITITRESHAVRRRHGSGDMVIPLRRVIGVTFHKPNFWHHGAIRFKIEGDTPPFRLLKGGPASEAFMDPYGMRFLKKHQAEFEAIKDSVNAAIAASA